MPTLSPHVAGSPTSRAAAIAKLPTAGTDEARVLDVIRALGGYGATDDELEIALCLLHQNASARRRTLVRRGLVKDSGRVRKTRSNRDAVVWIMCAEGEERTVTKPPTKAQWQAVVRALRKVHIILDDAAIAAMKWLTAKYGPVD